MPSEKVIQLRQSLAERFPSLRMSSDFPARQRAHWPTGLTQIDMPLHGGLLKGAITEFVAPSRSGSALLLHALLRQAGEANQFAALIDGRDNFDATELDQNILSRLLWVRCHDAGEALKAADILLRDRNLPLVILDLKLNAAKELEKIPGTTWYRFQRLIEQSSTVFLVITPRAMVASAEIRFTWENRFAFEDLDREQSELFSELSSEVVYERSAAEKRKAGQSA